MHHTEEDQVIDKIQTFSSDFFTKYIKGIVINLPVGVKDFSVTTNKPIISTSTSTNQSSLPTFDGFAPSFGDWIGGVIGANFPMNINDIQPEFVMKEEDEKDSSGTRKFGRPDPYGYQNVGILTPTESPIAYQQNVAYPHNSGYPQQPYVSFFKFKRYFYY